jgi:xyloglucan fucosyltransferase
MPAENDVHAALVLHSLILYRFFPLCIAVSDSGRPLATVPDPGDRLLGGLLSPDFDEGSCLSRYRAASFRRPSMHALSSHLVSALRRYEALHRLCGPGTSAYARAAEHLHAPTNASSDSECRYIVWTPTAGLGNQILSLTSAFLYALLTDRVLLVHRVGNDLDDLFCEPFPGSTWLLPEKDFPIRDIKLRTIGVPESLGSVLSRGLSPSGAPWLYVHLRHDYRVHDRRFFCDDVQRALRRVPWLVVMADNYFAPGLFLVPRLEAELSRLFPRRDAVFHHLGRYLFHPSNTVWGMVTRYQGSYFASADERVGVQVRMFKWAPISVDELHGQILACVHRENILPAATNATTAGSAKRKAVVFASLYNEFSEKLRDLYSERGAAGGEVVSVFQPSHLGAQLFGDRQQNQKAFAEMVLLSFADVAITTAASTFGYVSQGLAGRRPWVLAGPVRGKAPDTACRLAPTVEPCFHTPPNYDCRAKARGDDGKVVRYLRHCEDFPQGIQLVE